MYHINGMTGGTGIGACSILMRTTPLETREIIGVYTNWSRAQRDMEILRFDQSYEDDKTITYEVIERQFD